MDKNSVFEDTLQNANLALCRVNAELNLNKNTLIQKMNSLKISLENEINQVGKLDYVPYNSLGIVRQDGCYIDTCMAKIYELNKEKEEILSIISSMKGE